MGEFFIIYKTIIMKLRLLSFFALLLAVISAPVHAAPVTVNFQGLTGDGQGLLGHAFVPRASIAHMNSFYAGIGVAGPLYSYRKPGCI